MVLWRLVTAVLLLPAFASIEDSPIGESSPARSLSLKRIPPADELDSLEGLYVPLEHLCDGYDEQWGNCRDMPPCGECSPEDCQFAEWGNWVSGGGCTGLRVRHRTILRPANQCGQPCTGSLEMSEKFFVENCKPRGADCVFSAWQEWTTCVDKKDQAMRNRKVESPAEKGGAPCAGPLRETKPCGGPVMLACVFGPWHEWTSCSATCGPGRHTRMRRIDQESQHGGEACYDMVMETAACKAGPCEGQDCILSDWVMWSPCDEERTQQFRTRTIMQTAKGGGRPCDLSLSETQGCLGNHPRDCVIGEWSNWTSCDEECGGGQQYRERQVLSPASLGGRCPPTQLREAQACNTQPCYFLSPKDCILGSWQSWSSCTVTCGEGSMQRQRKLDQLAADGGKACLGPVSEVAPCSMQKCAVTDCTWGDWEDWSSCTCTCGGGTMRRTRHIAVSSNQGRSCEAKTKGEVAPCSTQPCGEGCVDGLWAEWTAWTECSATCGGAYMLRHRNVEVHPNYCGKAVSGLREEFVRCSLLPSCSPDIDCSLSEWGEWSHCSCHCFGIRERNRYIDIFPSGAGKPCEGDPLKMIEACNPAVGERTPLDCADRPLSDCQMGEWGSWSECSVSCGGGQMTRRRSIENPAENGGRPCEDILVTTAACGTEPCQSKDCQDCVWGQWTEWSDCGFCGSQRYRDRAIEVMPNKCGKPCDMRSAKEVSECPSKCDDVLYCAWTEWTAPTCQGCGQPSSIRSRTLAFRKSATEDFFFTGSGDAKCSGSQLNQSLCPLSMPCRTCVPVNCAFGAWSDWQEPSCLGLCERQRLVKVMNNECGAPCGGPLLETKVCPTECNHPKDCLLSQWGEWSECSNPDTLKGQRYRSRSVEQAPENGGKACWGVLDETAGCKSEVPEPCTFNEWHEWGACSASCGGGWHTRVRSILDAGKMGGLQCVGTTKELQYCEQNDPSCPSEKVPRDCELQEWQDWTLCSVDGQKFRDRQIKIQAAAGGKPCVGVLHEMQACEVPKVDCIISEWTNWDPCDKTCGSGQKHRQRQIHQFPENGGRPCPSELIQTQGCAGNPCPHKDCSVGDWSSWGTCSEQCGPGFQVRSREVLSLREAGGRGFSGALSETRDCISNPPCATSDCTWDEWTDWSDCPCSCGGGQRTRNRHIRTEPLPGGKPCPPEFRKEVEPCNTHPCSGGCQDGKWGDWCDWSPCTASCDGGTTFRKREIVQMANECGCPPNGRDFQTAFCNADISCGPKVDCLMSEWSEWSGCSSPCLGHKTRSRRIERIGRGNGAWCEGALQQQYPCNPGVGERPPERCVDGPTTDCVLSEWAEWSLCSVSCGSGANMRSRFIVQHPSNGGMGCDDSLTEVKECRKPACDGPTPIDCVLGNWEEWTECDRCSGERKRYRQVLSYPANGGKECEPFNMVLVGKCPRKCHAPKFCLWNDWHEWSDCTAPCGKGGKRSRRRHLHLAENATAFLSEDVLDAMSKYDALHLKAEELERHHLFQDVVLSFAAGGVVLLVSLTAVRASSSLRRSSARPGYADLSLAAGLGEVRTDAADAADADAEASPGRWTGRSTGRSSHRPLLELSQVDPDLVE